MVAFITGLLVGGAVGYITAALCWTAAEDDRCLLDELNMFDDEEIHENCTVQVWKNSVTGESSVGWWQN